MTRSLMEGADAGWWGGGGRSYQVTVGDVSAACGGGRVGPSQPGSVYDVKGTAWCQGSGAGRQWGPR